MVQGKFGAKPGRGASGSNPMVFVMGFFFLLFSVLGASLFYITVSSKVAPEKIAESQPNVETADILVALREIKAGSELDPSLFAIEPRPSHDVSSKIIRNFDGVRGKFAANDIIAGQPLHVDFVTDRKPSTTLQAHIPHGFRAVTIRVDATSSVEGWARPGARVDVTWIGSKNGEQIAKTIVEAAQILSYQGQTKVDTQNGENLAAPTTVTLLVTRDDSIAIQLAQSSGRLSLTLRNDADPDKLGLDDPTDLDDVIKAKDNVGKCREAMKRGIIRMPKPNNEIQEMVLNDAGGLSPLSEFCEADDIKKVGAKRNS